MSVSMSSNAGSSAALSLSLENPNETVPAAAAIPKLFIDFSKMLAPLSIEPIPLSFDPQDVTNGDNIYSLMEQVVSKDLTYVIAVIRENVKGNIFHHTFDAEFLENWRLTKSDNPISRQKINEVSYFIINKGENVFHPFLSISFAQSDPDSLKKIKFLQTYIKANQGDAEAQLATGFSFEDGIGIQKIATEAFRFYCLAAAQGHQRALRAVAVCFDLGKGVEKSLPNALKFHMRAADKGEIRSQYDAGMRLADGVGCLEGPDLMEATKYLKMAAEQGNFKAQEKLESLKIQLDKGKKRKAQVIDLTDEAVVKKSRAEGQEEKKES